MTGIISFILKETEAQQGYSCGALKPGHLTDVIHRAFFSPHFRHHKSSIPWNSRYKHNSWHVSKNPFSGSSPPLCAPQLSLGICLPCCSLTLPFFLDQSPTDGGLYPPSDFLEQGRRDGGLTTVPPFDSWTMAARPGLSQSWI